MLDALAGEFRGCAEESAARYIIEECNCRVLDALAGEFRGFGQESNVRYIIGEGNCRVLGGQKQVSREKRAEVQISIGTCRSKDF